MADTFTLLFLLVLTASVTVRIWLSQRHTRHVLAHRHRVPDEFADHIQLEAHQKAADYTLAKTRFGLIALTVETLLLLALTLGGGLDKLAGLWQGHAQGVWYGLALIFSVMAISAITDLPLNLWRQFVIEERFGFNRMNLRLFISDLLKSTLIGLLIGTPSFLPYSG